MNANDAEDWRELWSLDMPERVSLAVIRELEAYGVRVPGKLGLERANVSNLLSVLDNRQKSILCNRLTPP